MVTIDGDVVALGQAHSVTTANDNAHSEVLEAAKTYGPVTLEVASCARPAPTPCNSMAVDGARFVERGPCCRV